MGHRGENIRKDKIHIKTHINPKTCGPNFINAPQTFF